MALIKCSECGKEVSSKATSCPYCGNPIGDVETTHKQTNNSATFGYASIVGGILSLIGCFIPFLTISILGASNSKSLFGLSDMGFVVVGASLLGIVLSIPKPSNKYIVPFIAGIVNIIVAVSVANKIKANAGNLANVVQTDIGFYLVLGGSIAMIICSAIANSINKK